MPIGRKRAPGEIREILRPLFFIYVYFFPDSPTEVTRASILAQNSSPSGGAAYTIHSILQITAAVYFPIFTTQQR